jgi:hypothetical protein
VDVSKEEIQACVLEKSTLTKPHYVDYYIS